MDQQEESPMPSPVQEIDHTYCLSITCIIVMAIIGMALLAGIVEFKSSNLKQVFPKGNTAMVIGLVFCILFLGVSVVSLFKVTKIIRILQLGVLLVFALLLFIISITTFAFKGNISRTLGKIYKEVSKNNETISKIEDTFKCCGYDINDNERCANSTYNNITCKEKITQIVTDFAVPVGSVFITLFIIFSIIIGVIVYRYFYTPKDTTPIGQQPSTETDTTSQIQNDTKFVDNQKTEGNQHESNSDNMNDNQDIDSLFNNLSADVQGATDFITDVMSARDEISAEKEKILSMKEEFEKEKQDFNKYIKLKEEKLEKERAEFEDFVETKKLSLTRMEQQQKLDIDNANVEIENRKSEVELQESKLEAEKSDFENYKELEKNKIEAEYARLEEERKNFSDYQKVVNESLDSDRENLEADRNNFEDYKKLEEEKIVAEQRKLKQEIAKLNSIQKMEENGLTQEKAEFEREKTQFEKYKALESNKLLNERQVLSAERKQFERQKEVSEKKIELANKNIEQKYAEFKDVIMQFNTKFKKNTKESGGLDE